MRPSSTERRDEPRAGGVPRRNKQLGASLGSRRSLASQAVCVARGKSADDGHHEGDEDIVVVVGLAMACCCFSFEGTVDSTKNKVPTFNPATIATVTSECLLQPHPPPKKNTRAGGPRPATDMSINGLLLQTI